MHNSSQNGRGIMSGIHNFRTTAALFVIAVLVAMLSRKLGPQTYSAQLHSTSVKQSSHKTAR